MAGVAAGDFIVAFRVTLQTAVAASSFSTMKVKLTADGEGGLEEAIYLIRPDEALTTTQEYAAIGAGRRNESLTLPGRAQIKVAGKASDTSAPMVAALNRARDLMDLIVDAIRDNPPSVGDQTLRSIVERIDYLPVDTDQGWVVICDFDITATARVS